MNLRKLFKTRITIDPSWYFIFGLFSYMMATGYFPETCPGLSSLVRAVSAFLTVFLFFGCLVVHEMAHCAVAEAAGIEVKGITLFLFGGVSRLKSEPKSPYDEFRMAIAGPAVSFALAGAFSMISEMFIVSKEHRVMFFIFQYLAYANLIVGTFNLLPAFPLDGGRVLRSFIWHTTKNQKLATRAASIIGQVFGYSIMVFGAVGLALTGLFAGIWFMFIGYFLTNAARNMYKAFLQEEWVANTTLGFMTSKSMSDALRIAYLQASMIGDIVVSVEHFLQGLLLIDDKSAANTMTNAGFMPNELHLALRCQLTRPPGVSKNAPIGLTDTMRESIRLAGEEARSAGQMLSVEHVLLQFISQPDGMGARALCRFGCDLDIIRDKLARVRIDPTRVH